MVDRSALLRRTFKPIFEPGDAPYFCGRQILGAILKRNPPAASRTSIDQAGPPYPRDRELWWWAGLRARKRVGSIAYRFVLSGSSPSIKVTDRVPKCGCGCRRLSLPCYPKSKTAGPTMPRPQTVKSPSPTDKHVGKRVRMGRKIRSMSSDRAGQCGWSDFPAGTEI